MSNELSWLAIERKIMLDKAIPQLEQRIEHNRREQRKDDRLVVAAIGSAIIIFLGLLVRIWVITLPVQ